MSQKDTNFFNIDAMDQGIARTLGEGLTTRIFPGDKAMYQLSALRQTRLAPSIATRRNNGGSCWKAAQSAFKVVKKSPFKRAISGAARGALNMVSLGGRRALSSSTSLARHALNTPAPEAALQRSK